MKISKYIKFAEFKCEDQIAIGLVIEKIRRLGLIP